MESTASMGENLHDAFAALLERHRGIVLKVAGSVPGISAEQFQEAAEGAKTGCPVSQALSVPIELEVSFSG